MKAVKKIWKRRKSATQGTGSLSPPRQPGKSALKSHTTNPDTGVPAQLPTSLTHPPLTSTGSSQRNSSSAVNASRATPENPPQASLSEGPRNVRGRTSPGGIPSTSSASTADLTPQDFDSDEQGNHKHKGVSDTFRGLSVTERFDVAQEPADPNQMTRLADAYDAIPLLEQTRLPRGGISMETKAVGRVQVGRYAGWWLYCFCTLTFSIRCNYITPRSSVFLLKPSKTA